MIREESYEDGVAEGEAVGEAKGMAEGRAVGEAAGEARGRAVGEAIGEAKGRAEGKTRIKSLTSRNLAGRGLSVPDIAQIVGAGTSEVEQWLLETDN